MVLIYLKSPNIGLLLCSTSTEVHHSLIKVTTSKLEKVRKKFPWSAYSTKLWSWRLTKNLTNGGKFSWLPALTWVVVQQKGQSVHQEHKVMSEIQQASLILANIIIEECTIRKKATERMSYISTPKCYIFKTFSILVLHKCLFFLHSWLSLSL